MELHPRAQDILRVLQEEFPDDWVPYSLIADEIDINPTGVARPIQWLEEEGLVDTKKESTIKAILTEEGKNVLEEGFPEEEVLEKVKGGENTIQDIKGLGERADIGIGKAKQKGWIEIKDGELKLTEKGEAALQSEHKDLSLLKRIKEGHTPPLNEWEHLLNRGIVVKRKGTTQKVRLTEAGEKLNVSEVQDHFDVTAAAQDALLGRRHFASEVYDYIRQVWVEMGFQEMDGPIVVPSLLNFDALYTPQDHPARELLDTFFMEAPEEADLEAYGSAVDWIRQVHEDGWETGSTGWRYTWSEEEARRNVLRTHTTAVSAKTLWELTEDDLPAKYFALGRNFRNETVDWKHLAEFNQSEGIVVAEDVSFRNLLGYLQRFFTKLGYADVRFRPAYYPYTELSVEVDVYDQRQDEWVGLGGAGMFRPEVVKPLLGFEVPVLAWGLGPGRIIMRKHGLTDIRDMYRNDLDLLRNAQGWWR